MISNSSLFGQSVKTYQQDVEFLAQHTSVINLSNLQGQAKVVIAPEWQGRVMTSTTGGDEGDSFGWINYELVKKGIVAESQREGLEQHIHVFGGEERFWLGPEGGQYALFFPPSTEEYLFENWKTPALLDTDPFEVVSQTETSVVFKKSSELFNKSGTRLQFDIDRSIELLEPEALKTIVGGEIPASLKTVAFRSTNKLTNTGQVAWKRDAGLPSIWLLGMLKHGDDIVMAVPFKPDVAENAVNTDYFGAVEVDRLVVQDQIAYFKGDGKYRAKIGIPAARATPFCGSYHPAQNTLTILHFNLPENAAQLPYVRSQWEHHEHPYAGDVINCYNDGPPEPGADPLGPFYELETSSPALDLPPNDSYTHVQTTMHFTGEMHELNFIAEKTLGADIKSIRDAFK